MSTDNELPPHHEARAAVFSEGDEPTYALIGEIIHVTDHSNVTTQHLLMGQGLTLPIDKESLPVFEFFTTPRSRPQTEEWLRWAAAPPGFLEHLVKRGFVVRIDTKSSTSAAKSLRGIRLSAQSTPGEQRPNGFIGLMSQESKESGHSVMSISPELASVLWANSENHDIPSAIKKLAKVSGQDRELVARRVLSLMPRLLEHGFARLEWLRVPNS